MHQDPQVALKLLKQSWLNFELIGGLPAFHHQPPARWPMAIEPGRFVDHHRYQPRSSGKFEIEIDQAAVVSHQACPRHGDALGLVGLITLCLIQGQRQGAGFGAPRAAEEQGLIGAQQVQPKSVKPPGLHPSLEQAGAQLQGNQVWRERLEQLLQVPATLEACIEELHCG